MKKTFYYLTMLLGVMAFVGCNPMEDIHDEIDAELDGQLAVADADYTLTEDDYEELGQNFPNFSSLDDAKELIPTLLSDLYPTYGAGSQLNVSFDLYDPLRVEEYTVTSSDYASIDLSNGYFSGMGEIADFLDAKYPQAEEGAYVKLTYMILAEEKSYTLTDADFDLIGEELADEYPDAASSAAQYGNFDRRSDRDAYWSNEMIVKALAIVISEEFGDVKGQKYNVTYDIYDGSSGTESMTVQFDGNAYIAVGGTSYEFDSPEDYDFIGAEFAEAYPGPAGNVAQYHSFDIRSTSANYWSDAMLLEAFNALLMEKYPDATEGTQFEVSYATYSGSVSTNVISLILQGDAYVVDTNASVSTIEETKVFAYTNGSWDEPFMIPDSAYTEEFGQSYSNFDDEDEAFAKIATYLKLNFPYAEEGEMKAVAYKFYDGGTTTEYANFLFENGSWSVIPSVVTETLKFGYQDGMWVPDNTIKYALGGTDYGIIADALAGNADYATAVASMERYNNFDRRPGASAYWSDEMILEAMNALLDEIAGGAAEGQKYLLTYDIYNGSNTTEDIYLIKQGGEWVLFE
ncbi:hypothetical protein [Christiangramia flava]|uniref:Uncharacterized protein n=1 Tax=Christiangramia flava JLT2011 TaxID=1229726 RepID=A0A1L7I325_9FLAO|nr:hypothetical protein [Christiangramia flava]APU67971.1 hypothetical protein GRFL_1247 [Christiangramia flava JLT2011]OSS40472.1 hypothetical protein C723_0780 [Christiangramia flava JLT2011]